MTEREGRYRRGGQKKNRKKETSLDQDIKLTKQLKLKPTNNSGGSVKYILGRWKGKVIK